MVDFKAENTITTPNYQIVSVINLELWVNCIIAFEALEINDPNADDDHLRNTLRARLKALYRAIKPWYLSTLDKDQVDVILPKLTFKSNQESLEEAYNVMARFLYENGLLKINLKKPLRTLVAEEVNIDKGY